MSAHRVGYDNHKFVTEGVLADPGNGGTVDLNGQSGAVCVLESLTANGQSVILPTISSVGISVTIVNNTVYTGILVNDADAATIATIGAHGAGYCVSTGATWCGDVLIDAS